MIGVKYERKVDTSLPWRMYRHGLSYRLHHPDGRKINLGRDYDSALMRYQLELGEGSEELFHTDAPVNEMMRRHAKGAKQRGLSFSITHEHIKDVLRAQGYVCAVTGLRFRNDKPPGSRIRPWLPSIDRVNSSRGYEPGNVRVVCAFVNVALNAFGEQCFAQILGPLIEAEVSRRLATGGQRIPMDP